MMSVSMTILPLTPFLVAEYRQLRYANCKVLTPASGGRGNRACMLIGRLLGGKYTPWEGSWLHGAEEFPQDIWSEHSVSVLISQLPKLQNKAKGENQV